MSRLDRRDRCRHECNAANDDQARGQLHIMKILVILLLLSLVLGQTAAAPPSSAQPQTGASRFALATVADPKNRPLIDLGPDDFVIKEDGQARDVLDVHMADYPLVVLVDTSGAARPDFPQIRAAVARFIGRLGQRPLAVGTMSDPPVMVTSFEDDRLTVAGKLDALTVNPITEAGGGAGKAGRNPLFEGAAMAAQLLQRTSSAFSAIVVVSANLMDETTSPADDQVAAIIDSRAILHVVANRLPAGVDVNSRSSPRGSSALSGSPSAQMLRVLSQQTLGEFMAIYSSASYQAALDRLSERITSEMMIEYIVPAGSKASDVKMGVRIPGARVKGLGVTR